MARTAASPVNDPMKILSRRILVTITRNDKMTITSKVVWAHEMPILEHIFGEGNVKPVDLGLMDDGFSDKPKPELLPFNKKQDKLKPPSENASVGFVFFGDPRSEYERLCEAYGRDEEVNSPVCTMVYGRFQEHRFTQILGRPTIEDMPDAQIRDLIIQYGYLPVVSHDSSPEERREAAAVAAKLREMPQAELIKIAAEVGIEVGV